ncbi:hypothetical protein CBR_g34646 [Chara braunii]|uniref:HTH La-type RNA-binding domain-containing protein n=1 Tax=Chara braunii TaxID=69332 RepID=A0A388LJG2_CHABU|nr:hypothetical protein CBR_g34646 [Chara braunii]|eukprot:GBG82362.1 hypothetical protein CBR_g34646 [Chara braunii]
MTGKRFTRGSAAAAASGAMDGPITKIDEELAPSVLRQVEYYFSDSNLPRDKFLKEKVEEGGGVVSISLICTFSRMRGWLQIKSEDTPIPMATVLEVARVLERSTMLKITEDKTKVGRAEGLVEGDALTEKINARSLYAAPFPWNVTFDAVTEFFSKFAKVNSVHLRRHSMSKDFRGSVFVEFATEEDAKRVKAMKLQFQGADLEMEGKASFFEKNPYVERSKSDRRDGGGMDEEERPADEGGADAEEDNDADLLDYPKGVVVALILKRKGESAGDLPPPAAATDKPNGSAKPIEQEEEAEKRGGTEPSAEQAVTIKEDTKEEPVVNGAGKEEGKGGEGQEVGEDLTKSTENNVGQATGEATSDGAAAAVTAMEEDHAAAGQSGGPMPMEESGKTEKEKEGDAIADPVKKDGEGEVVCKDGTENMVPEESENGEKEPTKADDIPIAAEEDGCDGLKDAEGKEATEAQEGTTKKATEGDAEEAASKTTEKEEEVVEKSEQEKSTDGAKPEQEKPKEETKEEDNKSMVEDAKDEEEKPEEEADHVMEEVKEGGAEGGGGGDREKARDEQEEGIKREDLRHLFEEYGVIMYVDFSIGEEKGYVRFESEGEGKAAVEAAQREEGGAFEMKNRKLYVRLLEGDEEREYWAKVKQSQARYRESNKFGGRGRGRGRGRFGRRGGGGGGGGGGRGRGGYRGRGGRFSNDGKRSREYQDAGRGSKSARTS